MWYMRPAKAQTNLAQSDQSLCKSLEYSMAVKLLTERHLEVLNFKGGLTGSSESIHVRMPHCHGFFMQVLSATHCPAEPGFTVSDSK